jgi:hypothetical protein
MEAIYFNIHREFAHVSQIIRTFAMNLTAIQECFFLKSSSRNFIT